MGGPAGPGLPGTLATSERTGHTSLPTHTWHNSVTLLSLNNHLLAAHLGGSGMRRGVGVTWGGGAMWGRGVMWGRGPMVNKPCPAHRAS